MPGAEAAAETDAADSRATAAGRGQCRASPQAQATTHRCGGEAPSRTPHPATPAPLPRTVDVSDSPACGVQQRGGRGPSPPRPCRNESAPPPRVGATTPSAAATPSVAAARVCPTLPAAAPRRGSSATPRPWPGRADRWGERAAAGTGDATDRHRHRRRRRRSPSLRRRPPPTRSGGGCGATATVTSAAAVTTPPLTAAAPRLRQLPVTGGGLGAHPLPTPKSKPCNVEVGNAR